MRRTNRSRETRRRPFHTYITERVDRMFIRPNNCDISSLLMYYSPADAPTHWAYLWHRWKHDWGDMKHGNEELDGITRRCHVVSTSLRADDVRVWRQSLADDERWTTVYHIIPTVRCDGVPLTKSIGDVAVASYAVPTNVYLWHSNVPYRHQKALTLKTNRSVNWYKPTVATLVSARSISMGK